MQNNYNPYGGNFYGGNFGYNQNQYPNNYQQPKVNQQSTQYYWVNNIEGAKSFQMLPNQTVMLMDSENPVVYMKQTNNMGQATLKYFKLTEISEQEVRNQNIQPAPEYALKSDIDTLNEKLDSILKSLSSKEEINNG